MAVHSIPDASTDSILCETANMGRPKRSNTGGNATTCSIVPTYQRRFSSEFGRQVRENASAGTEHGTAGPVFLAGKGVKRYDQNESRSTREF
jgi:hypothetical protein